MDLCFPAVPVQIEHRSVHHREMRGCVSDVHIPDHRDIGEGHPDRFIIGHLRFFRLKAGASDQDGAGVLRREPSGIQKLQESPVQNGR